MARDNQPRAVADLAAVKQAQQRQQFLQAYAQGQAGARDRFGKILQPNDLVTWRPDEDLVFTIVDIKPDLDPRAPVGGLQIVLTVPPFTLRKYANLPIPTMIRIGAISADGQHAEVDPSRVPEMPEMPAVPVDASETVGSGQAPTAILDALTLCGAHAELDPTGKGCRRPADHEGDHAFMDDVVGGSDEHG